MTAALDDAPPWPDGVLFRPTWDIPWQKDYIARMCVMGDALLAADMGLGKCQPETEPVLTPTGWRPIGDIQPGDEVMGKDGYPTKVLSVHPQTDRRVYRVEMNDGSWTLAGPDHLWSVQDNNDMQRRPGQWQVLTTQELIDRGVVGGGSSKLLKWRIPMADPVQYREVDTKLPVDPYVLGAWLGDGHSWSGGFTSADEEIIEQIRLAGHEVTRYSSPYSWYIKDLMVDLRDLGILRNKHVPEVYLRASERGRLAVLQGLLDTDGWVNQCGGGAEFCTTLPALRDAVVELVQSLGGIARTGKTKETFGKDAYRIGVKLPSHMDPFRLTRKMDQYVRPTKYLPARRIKSITREPDQDCVCIRVAAEDSLYLTRHHIVTHNTVMALGVAGLLLEMDLIDGVLVVCERNKRKEWLADFGEFTRIGAAVYWGPNRKRLLDAMPPALITTYETCRSDVAVAPLKGTRGARSKTLAPGPLFKALAGRRMLVVYDEVTKLGRRTSALYKAHYWMVQQLRKGAGCRVIGATGTPLDTGIDNLFNVMRIVTTAMPTVAQFEREASSGRDPFGNLTFGQKGREWLRPFTDPWILRKRKSDPDVRDTFPPLVEKARSIAMHDDQFHLYRQLEDLAWDPDTREHVDVPGLEMLLRQLAGDPLAVLAAGKAGNSQLAVMVAEELGDQLASCSSAKAEELIELCDTVMAADGKILVFSFFTTVLEALRQRLGDRPVFMYTGQQSDGDREHQKAIFRAMNGPAIMLSSDAGARGINLPEISYMVEYEPARTFSLRQQRAGRGHRMGRTDPLTVITFVLESSLEGSRSVPSLLSRNADQDYLLHDDEAEGHVTAADRRAMFAQARKRKGA